MGDNLNKTNYLNQINKVANALKEIGTAVVRQHKEGTPGSVDQQPPTSRAIPEPALAVSGVWSKAKQRNVPRAAIAYIVVAWLTVQIVESLSRLNNLPSWVLLSVTILIIIGFPVAIVLAWKFERSPTGFVLTDSPMAKGSPFRPAQKKPFSSNTIIVGMLMISIAISISQRYWLPKSNGAVARSIAIIPFQSSTTDADQKNYGLGLASEIRTVLSQSKQFEFISSLQATRQYANTNETPTAIGNSLGVTHILSGFYDVSGQAIQITVELVDASNGNIIWSLPYKASLTDIFEIQADIAKKVLSRFGFQAENASNIPTTSLETYAHYLKGFELLNAGWREDIYNNAIKEFQSAIQLDSAYLPAWVGLVNARADMIWEINAADSDSYRNAKREIEYIHKHFPVSSLTRQADAIYQYHVLSHYNEALKLFTEVLEEDPENQLANGYAAAIYKRKLEFGKALAMQTKAKNQWPKSVTCWLEIGEILYSSGDYENEARSNKVLMEIDGTGDAKTRIFNSYRNRGILEQLPQEVINANTKRFAYAVNAQKRNWKDVRAAIDNDAGAFFPKFIAYDALGLTDSTQRVARRYLAAEKAGAPYDPAPHALALVFAGKKELAIRAMDSLWYNNGNLVPVDPEDKLMQARQKLFKVLVLSVARNYKDATELLKSINKDYPNYGDYNNLFVNPAFDRIKKEYPPFSQALNELKIPMKLELEKFLKL